METVIMKSTEIIELEATDIIQIADLAKMRWIMKRSSKDRINYAIGKKEGRLEHELLASIRSMVCEFAVAKHLNLAWNAGTYNNNLQPKRARLPDVGENIEVRNARTRNSVPLWKKDRGKMIAGARVVEEEYFSQVEFFGLVVAEDYLVKEYLEKDETYRIPFDKFPLSSER